MPNFNGTGPAGQGPMTGRGLGPCSGSQQSNPSGAMKRGQGFGRGGGRGRNFPGNPVSLEDQEKFLKNRLEAIQKLKKNPNSQN